MVRFPAKQDGFCFTVFTCCLGFNVHGKGEGFWGARNSIFLLFYGFNLFGKLDLK